MYHYPLFLLFSWVCDLDNALLNDLNFVVFTGQIVPYRHSPVRYFEPAPIQLGQSSVLHELKWVFYF